jgi:hypothetical protein
VLGDLFQGPYAQRNESAVHQGGAEPTGSDRYSSNERIINTKKRAHTID